MTTQPLPVPPPAVALAAGVTQYLLARGRRSTGPSRSAAAVVAGGSVLLAGATLNGFRRVGTTVDPHAPEQASHLVTDGTNAVTRNPMYLGLTGLLVAHAVLRRSVVALLPAAAFLVVLDRLQVPAEEAALGELFGAEYEAYRARVPRWLGPRA